MHSPLIDLHLHTTASDGRCTPEELVDRAWQAGIRVLSVTDHDTRAAEERARARAMAVGIEFISGMEITSVWGGKDVHVLAYDLPAEAPAIDALVAAQRQLRIGRARQIADHLARLGAPINIEALIAAASAASGKAVARPQIAQWLIEAGHVLTVAEAFDRFLSEGQPAYVPHQGASPAEVVQLVQACGGVASLAHPGYTNQDGLIPGLVDAGLPCLEAFHSAHDQSMQQRYIEIAKKYGLALSGGSDFHGEGTRRAEHFGAIGLPLEHFERLKTLFVPREFAS